MSAPPSGGGAPIENRRQLIEYFVAGNKPRAQWRMGTEHEKFGFDRKTLKPLPYDGATGIRAMLEGMTRFGWEPVVEGNNPIALERGIIFCVLILHDVNPDHQAASPHITDQLVSLRPMGHACEIVLPNLGGVLELFLLLYPLQCGERSRHRDRIPAESRSV